MFWRGGLHGDMLIVCMTSGTECAHVFPRRQCCAVFCKCFGRVEGPSQDYQAWEYTAAGPRR